MTRLHQPIEKSLPPIGISAIATFQPQRAVANAWFESLMARKFVKHTGIHSRCVADEDEVALGLHAVEQLARESRCDFADCAAVILASPSLVPQPVARRLMDREAARAEQPNRVAHRLAASLADVFPDCRPRRIMGLNGFCSGYAKATVSLRKRLLPTVDLQSNEFVLLITSSRISRITDFGCKQSGALFGDFATATLISRTDSPKYPVHLEILDADYHKVGTSRPYFDFSWRENVLEPTADGGRQTVPTRLVFSLDGMGIADTAPRAMAIAAEQLAVENGLSPSEVDWVIPHQAGEGIVRLTAMKLEEAGIAAAPVNGLTATTGNVSSGSVPMALKQHWHQLQGNILCPVAAVGAPGKPEVSQGCLLLRASPRQRAISA